MAGNGGEVPRSPGGERDSSPIRGVLIGLAIGLVLWALWIALCIAIVQLWADQPPYWSPRMHR